MNSVTARIFIEDNAFYVADPDDPDSPMWSGEVPLPFGTGLVAARGSSAGVICGVNVGWVEVTLEAWDEQPPAQFDGWDDVAEVSARWVRPRAYLIGATVDGAPEVFVDLPPSPEGDYRVRAHARERDAGEDRDEGDPVETHLVRIWPAPAGEEQLLKATDAVGRGWREAPAPE